MLQARLSRDPPQDASRCLQILPPVKKVPVGAPTLTALDRARKGPVLFWPTEISQARTRPRKSSGCAYYLVTLTYRHTQHMSRHMTERTTVRLPADLLNRAKRKALAQRRTLTSLIEEGLRIVVGDGRKPKRERRPLPLSSAAGPPLPGIDISNSAALQEMDDLEYAERLKNGFK
jgi:hypothetical protein